MRTTALWPPPSAVNLRPGDLPAGWSTAEIPGEPSAFLRSLFRPVAVREHGRRFCRRGDAFTNTVVAWVSRYKTPASAHAAFLQYQTLPALAERTGGATLLAPHVGEERVAVEDIQHGLLLGTAMLVFRRRTYVGVLKIQLDLALSPTREILRLAKVMDTRIQQSHYLL